LENLDTEGYAKVRERKIGSNWYYGLNNEEKAKHGFARSLTEGHMELVGAGY
jgi:hypothetical protein